MISKRKTVFLSNRFVNTNPAFFVRRIDVPFQPSYVIVRQLSYNIVEASLNIIRVNFVEGGILGVVDDATINPGSILNVVNGSLNGEYRIEVIDDTGAIPTDRTGHISIQLEFVE